MNKRPAFCKFYIYIILVTLLISVFSPKYLYCEIFDDERLEDQRLDDQAFDDQIFNKTGWKIFIDIDKPIRMEPNIYRIDFILHNADTREIKDLFIEFIYPEGISPLCREFYDDARTTYAIKPPNLAFWNEVERKVDFNKIKMLPDEPIWAYVFFKVKCRGKIKVRFAWGDEGGMRYQAEIDSKTFGETVCKPTITTPRTHCPACPKMLKYTKDMGFGGGIVITDENNPATLFYLNLINLWEERIRFEVDLGYWSKEVPSGVSLDHNYGNFSVGPGAKFHPKRLWRFDPFVGLGLGVSLPVHIKPYYLASLGTLFEVYRPISVLLEATTSYPFEELGTLGILLGVNYRFSYSKPGK